MNWERGKDPRIINVICNVRNQTEPLRSNQNPLKCAPENVLYWSSKNKKYLESFATPPRVPTLRVHREECHPLVTKKSSKEGAQK